MMRSIALPLFFIILLIAACDSNKVFQDHEGIPEMVWKKDNTVRFEVPIEDKSMPYDVHIALRHHNVFPYNNLLFTLDYTAPGGTVSKESYNLMLAGEDNAWKGECLGDLCDVELPLLEKVTFPENGTYTFELTHTMPEEEIPLLMEVGLVVIKSTATD